MDILKNVNEQVKQIPIIGEVLSKILVYKSIVFILILLIIINKGLRDYLNVDLLGKLLKLFTKYINNIPARKRKKYFECVSSKRFIEWEMLALRKIYDSDNFILVQGIEYPVACFSSGKNGMVYPFNKLNNEENLTNTNLQDEIKLNRLQKEYLGLLGDTIKRPKLEGYALDELKFDENGDLTFFTAYLCNYKQNVVTSHILEYELYKTYLNKKARKMINKLNKNDLLNMMPLRRNIHQNKQIREVLTTGANRVSLLGVQLLIAFLDANDNKYKLLIMKRSQDVAVRPGYWQFIPSGGFELYECNANSFSIKNNFDVTKAVFREFVEEVFGEKEYEDNKDGNPVENVINHDKVKFILQLIEKNEASFQFLGSVVDLIGLRHELSFLLVIDTVDFSKNIFKKNHEAMDMQRITFEDIKDILNGNEFLNPGSAGLLKLAIENQLFKEKILSNNQK